MMQLKLSLISNSYYPMFGRHLPCHVDISLREMSSEKNVHAQIYLYKLEKTFFIKEK